MTIFIIPSSSEFWGWVDLGVLLEMKKNDGRKWALSNFTLIVESQYHGYEIIDKGNSIIDKGFPTHSGDTFVWALWSSDNSGINKGESISFVSAVD